MKKTYSTMQMPELLVFARTAALGLILSETIRVSHYLGGSFAVAISSVDYRWRLLGVALILLLCVAYAGARRVDVNLIRLLRSARVDLGAALGVGVWIDLLIEPLLDGSHAIIKSADPYWASASLLLLCAVIASPLIRWFRGWRKPPPSQLYFISDTEIDTDAEDLLDANVQARSFAEIVLASEAHSGLVFGVDGPWGVGKTSFINLAQRYWETRKHNAIVCRFEPIRYASEPDLSDRLIRELSASIQSQVFVPELQPAATRYTRLLKGRADISFLGLKLSLLPSGETADDLLDDIDNVLKHIGRRVIIVIDDLDRLDSKAAASMLFATRRTFRLTQATYVLSYDTELLTRPGEDSAKAREFLEKFVTVKLSLFVDSSQLTRFLRRDWQRPENHLGNIPSDTMLKLGAVLAEIADMLEGDNAAMYVPILGDLRKLKRFVNAVLLMQIERTELGRTDFNKRDLINLMLLQLNYPGLFRQIYAEESAGRTGSFSVRRKAKGAGFENTARYREIVGASDKAAQDLLAQLFDVAVLELEDVSEVDEPRLRSRACFNESSRNLEKYLRLIVRFAAPEPQDTFVLYYEAVSKVKDGASVRMVLMSPDFDLKSGEKAHDQFWRVLVNESNDLREGVANDAIDTLVEYLPRYPSVERGDRGLRQRSIYSLIRLLDRAGWGRTKGGRRPNTDDYVLEIAWRIFGEEKYKARGLLDRLASDDRGVLGWNDLMLFRLQCSADRQGQVYNLHRALVLHHDKDAQTSGLVSTLAKHGMRQLSQQVFARFKRDYIIPGRNYFAEVDREPSESFFGDLVSAEAIVESSTGNPGDNAYDRARLVLASRTVVKSFVVYQLANKQPPNGAGVGCGYYDEAGQGDLAGISRAMADYAFGFCFNPELNEGNAILFLDHCLSNLSSTYFSGQDEGKGYVALKSEIPGGLGAESIGKYWIKHGDSIRRKQYEQLERSVVHISYTATYRDDLSGVYQVLDELASEARSE